jgi:hypothetical protein
VYFPVNFYFNLCSSRHSYSYLAIDLKTDMSPNVNLGLVIGIYIRKVPHELTRWKDDILNVVSNVHYSAQTALMLKTGIWHDLNTDQVLMK